MFNIVKLSLFFLLIIQANCSRNLFANFRPFEKITEWSHRIWNPQAKTNPNVRTTVDFENGNTVVTALIGGQRHNATFPGKQIVSTTRYFLITETGTKLGKFEISVGNQTYIYETVDGQTTVTDGQGNLIVNGDPFNISTNNTVSATNYTIGTSV